ncbi:MAG: class I SAM-dependent methyltransferase [Sphingomicrobium sp.]
MELSAQSKVRLARSDIHEQWESDYLNPEMDRFYDRAFARILEVLDDTRGKTLLDAGCGYCYHTRRLAKSELAITAVDFSNAALEQAQSTLADAGLTGRISLRQADLTALPFADASFDHVLMWGVLMHIPEAEKALSEIARVLKPGGTLVLAENNARSLEVRFLEPVIESARRILGRPARTREETRLGIEEWQSADRGGLLVRKTDMRSLVEFCQGIGLELTRRFAGELTQIYTRLPGSLLKRLVYGLNRFYFRHIRVPGPALGNILFFRKSTPKDGRAPLD